MKPHAQIFLIRDNLTMTFVGDARGTIYKDGKTVRTRSSTPKVFFEEGRANAVKKQMQSAIRKDIDLAALCSNRQRMNPDMELEVVAIKLEDIVMF
ncbi:hypothetical protein Dxin01_00146 [Deinococcus xinjiangensis]|uniref:Uncharacterized protein n=1 Tax=Deinococcus xinjiangensis TaxID=457454 RepID=A0ABP9V7D0_9DEIO